MVAMMAPRAGARRSSECDTATVPASTSPGPVSVLHRTGQWCPGVLTTDAVIAYDMQILPAWQVPGRPTTDRAYVLSDEGVQLTRPVGFVDQLEGGWYVDLVELVDHGDRRLEVRDLYVDFVVPPTGRRYEVLDLDELGDALADGSLTPAEVVTVLRNAQRFVDRHLRDLDSAQPTEFPDFPPAGILPLVELPPLQQSASGPEEQ